MLKRLVIMVINIIFPPIAVMLLCGPQTDLIINCILFICAVIPSHIHAFYISWTYFSRKRKARRGQYPGDWRRGIYSERVQYGGASRSEYMKLKAGRDGGMVERSWSRSDKNRRKIEDWDDGMSEKWSVDDDTSRTNTYNRPTYRRNNTDKSNQRTSTGAYSQVTQGDNIRPAASRRQSSRRSIYDRPGNGQGQRQDTAGVNPSFSRTNSGNRGRERRERGMPGGLGSESSDGGDISPILPPESSRRRVY